MKTFLSILILIATTTTLYAQVLPDQNKAGRLSPAQEELLRRDPEKPAYMAAYPQDDTALNEVLKLKTLTTANIITVLQPHLNVIFAQKNGDVNKRAINAQNRLASYSNNNPDVVSLLQAYEISFKILKEKNSWSLFGKKNQINKYLIQLDQHLADDSSTASTQNYLHMIRAFTTAHLHKSYDRYPQSLSDFQKVQPNFSSLELDQETQTIINAEIKRLTKETS